MSVLEIVLAVVLFLVFLRFLLWLVSDVDFHNGRETSAGVLPLSRPPRWIAEPRLGSDRRTVRVLPERPYDHEVDGI